MKIIVNTIINKNLKCNIFKIIYFYISFFTTFESISLFFHLKLHFMKRPSGLVLLLTAMLSLFAIYSCEEKPGPSEPATLELDPSEGIVFDAQGGTKTVKVISNRDWSVESDQPDYFAVQRTTDTTFTVTVGTNENEEAVPAAIITVTAGEGNDSVTKTLNVSQNGKDPLTLSITLENITATSADMKVVPSYDNARFYYDVLAVHVLDEHHSGDLAVYMENMMAEAVSTFGDIESALEAICSTGEQSYQFTGQIPETEYIAFAAGLDDEGKVSSEIAFEKYTTLALENANFDVEFANIAHKGFDYTVTPSDGTMTYYHCIRPVFGYNDLSDEELRQTIINEDSFMIDFFATSGETTYTNENVYLADTGYMVLIFGWSSGAPTTEIARFYTRTLAPETSPEKCTFSFEVSGITARSASVTITPSDEFVPYIFDAIAEKDYESYKDDMNGYVKTYIAENVPDLDYGRWDGVQQDTYWSVLEPGTTYYNWAACVDEYGNVIKVTVSEPFTTLPKQESSASVSAEITGYFNGDELAELYPEDYSDGKGMAYVQVEFSVNEDASTWYGGMFKEDPNDHTSNISDDEIAEILASQGTWCPTGKLYWAEWDAEYTILAVAIGKDENYSKVFRHTVTFTKDGANDISEFVKPENPFAYNASESSLEIPAYTPKVVMYRTKSE